MKRLAAFIVMVCSVQAVTISGQAPPPTAAEEKQKLSADITAVDASIKEAEDEDAKYVGGLVKTLVEVRLAILKQTRAMLAQRQAAASYNTTLRYTVDGQPFVAPPADLASIASEVEAMKK